MVSKAVFGGVPRRLCWLSHRLLIPVFYFNLLDSDPGQFNSIFSIKVLLLATTRSSRSQGQMLLPRRVLGAASEEPQPEAPMTAMEMLKLVGTDDL